MEPKISQTYIAAEFAYNNKSGGTGVSKPFMKKFPNEDNKELRRDIIKMITSETKPLTKCSVFAVSDILKSNFDQITLF